MTKPIRRNSSVTTIDFRQLPLSQAVRHRLAAIDESRKLHPHQKMALARWLLSHACDRSRGIYVPMSSHPFVTAKLTEDFASVQTEIRADVGTPLCLFGNPLLLPSDFESSDFDRATAVKPMLRTTNAGAIVTTIEFDCRSRNQCEEMLTWLAPAGRFKEVDSELKQYRDYRGHSVVFTGNRSIHFHFVFETGHLKEAPSDASWDLRLRSHLFDAAIMTNAHEAYWDIVASVMTEMLAPPVQADKSMRSYTQFKRMPWGIRKLESGSDILGLPKDTLIPQLVLAERIRASRSPKGSDKLLVAPDFSIGNFLRGRSRGLTQAAPEANEQISAGVEMVNELALMCEREWKSEYPKPVRFVKDRGHWTVNFQNHADDQNPSSVATGDFTTVRVLGNFAPQGTYTLPGGLTADELGDHMARRFGVLDYELDRQFSHLKNDMTSWQRLKLQSGRPFKDVYQESVSRTFPFVSSSPVPELQAVYRLRLWRYFDHAMSFEGDMICLSAEGIGKTWALFDLMQNQALDTALSHGDGKHRFFVFAFRSRAQAEQKAAEYRAGGIRRAFVLKPFWFHYEEVCTRLGVSPMLKEEFDEDADIFSVLGQIDDRQPAVFDELERLRKFLWLAEDGTSLFSGTTVIFTTHATSFLWPQTRLTRIWHHPEFSLACTSEKLEALRTEFVFEKVVVDEPEWDEFVYLLSFEMYDHLWLRRESPWSNIPKRARKDQYNALRQNGRIPAADMGFAEYDELRRCNIAAFNEVRVDYAGQPFGRDNSAKSIYRSRHGTPYFLMPKQWPMSGKSTNWIYLTTETFTTESIAAVYGKLGKSLLQLKLDNLPGLYPIDVPIAKNRLAKAQTVQTLATEILASTEQAVVISDGLGPIKGARAKTFQGMKGYNDWADKDVFIVFTHLHPEVFARLNVLGVWLLFDDSIAKYYAAQLSQAVGRNTGFRKQHGTRTVVVATEGLLRLVGSKLAKYATRVRLVLTPEKFW